MGATAWAQPPFEVIPDTQITLAQGQSKTFRFDQSFTAVHMGMEGIAEARPQNDRQISITGKSAGQTQMFIYGPDGRDLFSATITVGEEPGGIVRLFDGRSKDYAGYYCTPNTCGRADKGLNGARDVTSVTTVAPSGVAVTRTFGGAPAAAK